MRVGVDFEENSSSVSIGEAGRARWFNLRRQDNIDCVKSSTNHLEACVQYKELFKSFPCYDSQYSLSRVDFDAWTRRFAA